jgi:XisI protein
MAGLSEIVKDEVSWYAGSGRGAGIKLFRLLDDVNQTYAVTAILDPNPDNDPAGLVVLARIVGDVVVIEEDRTDRPLVDSLMHAGIPREKIILAYAGEPIPDPQP